VPIAVREGPGVNYALNWALCAKGVVPKGEAYRNLRESQLKKLNANIPGKVQDVLGSKSLYFWYHVILVLPLVDI
jgi:hypothetical protein